MLSDDQFSVLIDKVSRNQEDHDILIEIRGDLRWLKESFVAHTNLDAAIQRDQEKSILASHKRIDNNSRFQYLVMGGLIVISTLLNLIPKIHWMPLK